MEEDEALEIMYSCNNQEMDSAVLKNPATSVPEDQFGKGRDGPNAASSVLPSGASTPTSVTEYQSCSNPSTPDKKNAPSELKSVSSQSELIGTSSNVKMSANIASKLSEMQVSLEKLDSESQTSLEEEAAEILPGAHSQETTSAGQQPSVPRKPILKPSLRQVFPYISCLPFENNIVFCFVLSVWDNIVGPQTVYVWKRKSYPSQKTFDELYDDRDGIEVGEDSMDLDQSPSIVSEAQSEIQFGVEVKDRENLRSSRQKISSRKSSVISSQSDDQSSTSSNNLSNISLTRLTEKSQDQSATISAHLPCDVEMKVKTGVDEKSCKESDDAASLKSGSIKNELRKVDFQKESSVEKKLNEEISDEVKEHSGKPYNLFAPSSSVDNWENENQEFSSKWSCGPSRLRMATVVRYVTEHSVAVGQVGTSSEKINSSFLVVPHQGIMMVAARFSVMEEDGAVPYCVSMVVPLEEYDYFLPLTCLVTSWLVTIAAATRLFITKYGLEGGGRIKGKLVELCEVLVALRSASLDQYPLSPAGRPPDDRRLAEIILTSHLQTLGTTLVVADSPNAANKVVMWIAQFSDPKDLPLSRLCLSYAQWPYHPGLAIQGIVRNASGEVNLSAQKLIQSFRPLTVVDITYGTVKQTGSPDVHARRNSSALHQELLSLWHDLPDVSATSESLLEPVRTASPLVKRFLHDYDRLSSCENEVRQNFIKAFLRSLKYTALALISWAKNEWSVQQKRSGFGSLRRALCSVFELEESDLRVVLAQAELLQPGFYSFAMT